MRTMRGLALTLVVAWAAAPAVRADDRDTARAVIDAAVKAHGGTAALTKAQTVRRTATGFQLQAGREVPLTSQDVLALPDRVRMDVTLDKRMRFVSVVNGDKGWIQVGGAPVLTMAAPRLKEYHEEVYVLWIATLVPLQKGAFELAPLAEIKVNGKPALGVKVSSKGHADAKLYFDKATKLLVKIERRVSASGLVVAKEYLFGNYKDFDGAKLRTSEQEKINGKATAAVTAITYKFLPRVDDKLFAKP